MAATGHRLLLTVALALCLSGCSPVPEQSSQPMAQETGIMADHSINAVLEEHSPRLLSLPGVVGVGRGECDGQPCIKVMVVQKTAELAAQIGGSVEGFRIEIIESGEIRAKGD